MCVCAYAWQWQWVMRCFEKKPCCYMYNGRRVLVQNILQYFNNGTLIMIMNVAERTGNQCGEEEPPFGAANTPTADVTAATLTMCTAIIHVGGRSFFSISALSPVCPKIRRSPVRLRLHVDASNT